MGSAVVLTPNRTQMRGEQFIEFTFDLDQTAAGTEIVNVERLRPEVQVLDAMLAVQTAGTGGTSSTVKLEIENVGDIISGVDGKAIAAVSRLTVPANLRKTPAQASSTDPQWHWLRLSNVIVGTLTAGAKGRGWVNVYRPEY